MMGTENKAGFSAFKAAYRALCREYKLQIHPSEYDSLQVWSIGEDELLELVDRTVLVDKS